MNVLSWSPRGRAGLTAVLNPLQSSWGFKYFTEPHVSISTVTQRCTLLIIFNTMAFSLRAVKANVHRQARWMALQYCVRVGTAAR